MSDIFFFFLTELKVELYSFYIPMYAGFNMIYVNVYKAA